MELVLSLAIGIVFASGIWLVLRPRSFQVLCGLMLMSYAVNLFIFAMGRLWIDAPPLTPAGTLPNPAILADPLPQALPRLKAARRASDSSRVALTPSRRMLRLPR